LLGCRHVYFVIGLLKPLTRMRRCGGLQALECVVCELRFKTQRARQRHEQSTQHAQERARLQELLLADDAL
jgi:Zinc-finger double-stranded RNA-binding